MKIDYLSDQIQIKYYFVAPHTCGVGTPRIFLTIDTDGDGKSNGNAFGYIGAPPEFGPCATNTWRFEDLTDMETRWDLTQFGGAFYNTWQEVVAFFDTLYPNHTVLARCVDVGLPALRSTVIPQTGSVAPRRRVSAIRPAATSRKITFRTVV